MKRVVCSICFASSLLFAASSAVAQDRDTADAETAIQNSLVGANAFCTGHDNLRIAVGSEGRWVASADRSQSASFSCPPGRAWNQVIGRVDKRIDSYTEMAMVPWLTTAGWGESSQHPKVFRISFTILVQHYGPVHGYETYCMTEHHGNGWHFLTCGVSD